jgi:putative FmdB family regulatory protein
MRHPHRCNACGRRFTLVRPMAHYKIDRECPHCGSSRIFYDTYKRKERLGRKAASTCLCDGAHYPHRRGSLVWCKFHPAGPSIDDYLERYQHVST